MNKNIASLWVLIVGVISALLVTYALKTVLCDQYKGVVDETPTNVQKEVKAILQESHRGKQNELT